MALLETWRKLAYETEMNQNQATQFWGNYFNLEKGIYEQILSTPDEPVSGTVKELAEKFNVSNRTVSRWENGNHMMESMTV